MLWLISKGVNPHEVSGRVKSHFLRLQMGNGLGLRHDLLKQYREYCQMRIIAHTNGMGSKQPLRLPKIEELFPAWNLLYQLEEIKPMEDYTPEQIDHMIKKHGFDILDEMQEASDKRAAKNASST